MNKVVIILCTFNGAKFLEGQLKSLLAQTYKNWSLYVSDDGSNDSTMSILNSFKCEFPDIEIVIDNSHYKSFSKNFIETAKKARTLAGKFYAFCDQDDVWYPKKLEWAISALERGDLNRPSLYCSRTQYITADGEDIAPSFLMSKLPSLQNALVQSIAGGNTMVFNDLACNILGETPFNIHIPSHDWWLYLLVASFDGLIIYDPEPLVGYRQHANSLIGGNISFHSRLQRLFKALGGRYADWNKHNLDALEYFKDDLPLVSKRKIDTFKKAREEKFLISRAFYLIKSGVYRQSYFGTCALFCGCLVGKI